MLRLSGKINVQQQTAMTASGTWVSLTVVVGTRRTQQKSIQRTRFEIKPSREHAGKPTTGARTSKISRIRWTRPASTTAHYRGRLMKKSPMHIFHAIATGGVATGRTTRGLNHKDCEGSDSINKHTRKDQRTQDIKAWRMRKRDGMSLPRHFLERRPISRSPSICEDLRRR